MEYPTREGRPVPMSELELPESRLNLDRRHNVNNHHLFHAERRRHISEFIILQTMKDLDTLQDQIGVDVHNYTHATYDPPALPTPQEALVIVYEAFEAGELLRTGSAYNPVYKQMTTALMEDIEEEYRMVG